MVILLVLMSVSTFANSWTVITKDISPEFAGSIANVSNDNNVTFTMFKDTFYITYDLADMYVSEYDELLVFITKGTDLKNPEIMLDAFAWDGMISGVIPPDISKKLAKLDKKEYHVCVYNYTADEFYLYDSIFNFTGFSALYSKTKKEN